MKARPGSPNQAKKTTAIRPANDSRPGPEKLARDAKVRASRARDEIVAFKRVA